MFYHTERYVVKDLEVGVCILLSNPCCAPTEEIRFCFVLSVFVTRFVVQDFNVLNTSILANFDVQ